MPDLSTPDDTRALLAVVDSRGSVRNWETVRQSGYFRDVVALCSWTSPPSYLAYLESHHIGAISTGGAHVDLRDAIRQLSSRYHAKRIRVDSGGMLNGVLRREGLVDEINLLVHPCLVGGTALVPSSGPRASPARTG